MYYCCVSVLHGQLLSSVCFDAAVKDKPKFKWLLFVVIALERCPRDLRG